VVAALTSPGLATVLSGALGLVFLVAGGSKVAAGAHWPAQAAGLGVPHRVAPLVPWFELVVGAVLLAGLWRPWPATVALVTLAVFTAVLAWHLAHGRQPACACFGAWSAEPIGVGHLVRNGVFVALAIVSIVAS
jgi:uncharacterized membrane protein YphA (DoxX/SURF4 family)